MGSEHQRLREATAILVGDDARLASRAEAVRAVLQQTDPDVALELWRLERIAPFAIHRASALGVEHRAWSELSAAIGAESERRSALDELVLIQVTRALIADHYDPVVLKGSTLASRLYGDLRLRDTSADADLLVPTSQLFDAAARIVALGWSPPADPLLANGLPEHHLVLRPAGGQPIVELHWRVQWFDTDAHTNGLVAGATTYRGLPVLGDVGLLDLLLQTWARDGFHKLRLGVDIAAWWRTFGDTHADAVAALYTAPNTGRAAAIAATAAARLFGTPTPAAPPTDRAARSAVAIACSDVSRRGETRPLTQRALVDPLISPPEQRRARLFTSWVLAPELSRSAHPWAPAPLVPLLRAASALRTAMGGVPIALRAWRFGRRSRQPT